MLTPRTPVSFSKYLNMALLDHHRNVEFNSGILRSINIDKYRQCRL